MDIIEILKEHFADHMTPDIETNIKKALDVLVAEKIADKQDEIRLELEEEMKQEVQDNMDELIEKLDTYTEEASEELINENLENIEQKAKVEIAENFIEGILKVFKENNMNIEQDDKNIVEQLEAENKKTEDSLNSTMSDLIESKKQIQEYEKAMAVISLTKELTETEAEKVVSIVENIKFTDLDSFKDSIENAITIVTEKSNDDENNNDNDELIEKEDKTKKKESVKKKNVLAEVNFSLT